MLNVINGQCSETTKKERRKINSEEGVSISIEENYLIASFYETNKHTQHLPHIDAAWR
jgi:hypothetical protein